MILIIETIKNKYSALFLREKIIFMIFNIVLVCIVSTTIILNPLRAKMKATNNDIQQIKSQLVDWKMKMISLKKIPESHLYKQWVEKDNELKVKKETYKAMLQASAYKQWREITNKILGAASCVKVRKMQNEPETIYNIPDVGMATGKIYQQKMSLVIDSSYVQTYEYLKYLEKNLPTMHWEKLKYKVESYPTAQVDMELSVLYEKNS